LDNGLSTSWWHGVRVETGLRGFPSFGATLTVGPAGKDTDLVLEGSYEPPGGVVGRLFDRVVGQRLAARTMDALLDQVAHQV
jgi:hypothetical protein